MMLRLLYRRFYSSSHLGSRKVLQFFPFLIELPHGSGQAILFYPRVLAQFYLNIFGYFLFLLGSRNVDFIFTAISF